MQTENTDDLRQRPQIQANVTRARMGYSPGQQRRLEAEATNTSEDSEGAQEVQPRTIEKA